MPVSLSKSWHLLSFSGHEYRCCTFHEKCMTLLGFFSVKLCIIFIRLFGFRGEVWPYLASFPLLSCKHYHWIISNVWNLSLVSGNGWPSRLLLLLTKDDILKSITDFALCLLFFQFGNLEMVVVSSSATTAGQRERSRNGALHAYETNSTWNLLIKCLFQRPTTVSVIILEKKIHTQKPVLCKQNYFVGEFLYESYSGLTRWAFPMT